MNAILDALSKAIADAIPYIFTALVPCVYAWIKWLEMKAHVREEVTASAVRQALLLHGDTAAAEQAAVDELRMMSPSVRPKDAVGAVTGLVDRLRSLRASQAPTADEDGE